MSRLIDRRNAKRVNGLRRDPRTGAGKLAKAERGYGGVLAFDFTDNSVALYDPTTQANVAYTQGVTDGNGNFRGPHALLTYTSPSNKLTMQSDGFIKYQAHNLYLNSAAPANQSITVISGASYAVTITGTVSVTASGAATGTWTAGTNTFTAATTTLTLGSTSGSGTVHVRRTPSNDDYIETAGAAKYALPLEYDTSGNCLGLLVEEQRTNLCLQSADFANTWTTTECTVSANAATAPNGLTHADKLIPSTNNAAHYVNQSITFTAAAYAFSAYCKADGYNYIQIFDSVAGTAYANFNLSTGAVGNTSDYTASIESVGNGWYRVCVVFTMTASARTMRFCPINADTASRAPAFAGDGTSGVLIWGAQAELGSFPTSPIITYGATATRAADNISIATSAFPFTSTAGSVFIEYELIHSLDTTLGTWHLIDNAGSNASSAYSSASTSRHLRMFNTAATEICAIDAGTVSTGVTTKSSGAWAVDDFASVLDGGTVGTDVSGTYNGTPLNLYFGRDRSGANTITFKVKALSYVPRRKTNAELQAETA